MSIGILITQWRTHCIIEYPEYPTHFFHLILVGKISGIYLCYRAKFQESSSHPRTCWSDTWNPLWSLLFPFWWLWMQREHKNPIPPFFQDLLCCGPGSHSSFPVERKKQSVSGRVHIIIFFFFFFSVDCSPFYSSDFSCRNSILLHNVRLGICGLISIHTCQLTRDRDAHTQGFPILNITKETLTSTHSFPWMVTSCHNFWVDYTLYVKRRDYLILWKDWQWNWSSSSVATWG